MRKFIVLSIFMLSIALLLFCYVQVLNQKGDGTFVIQNRVGDRSALEGVQISGEWFDGYHRTFFVVSDKDAYKETEIFAVPHYHYDSLMLWGTDLDGVYAEVRGSYGYYELRFKENITRNKTNSGSVQVNTSLSYRGLDGGRTSEYSNPLEYGLARIQDDIYFTVPTTKNYFGNNAIYKVPLADEADVEEIALYSLDSNKDEYAPAVEVLGLEAVNDQLILVLAEGNSLLLQVYRKDGQYVGNLKMEEVAFSEGDFTHSVQYEAFPDHEQNKLNLLFRQSNAQEDQRNITILSVDLLGGIQTAELVRHAYFEDVYDSINTIREVRYLNDRLILVQTESFKHEQIPFAVYMKRFMIYVFQAGELQYQGELQTDHNDDLIRAMKRSPEGYGFDLSEHRRYDSIQIAEGEGIHD